MRRQPKANKIKMNAHVKWLLVGILSMGVIILALLLYQELKKVDTRTEEKILYNYLIDTTSQYQVHLLPNALYTEDILGEGKIYLSNFIKGLDTTFTTSIEVSEGSTIKGNYQIIAQVASYTIEKDKKKDIWSKNYILAPTKSFSSEGDHYQVEKTVQVNYPSYNEFAKQIAQATGVNTPSEVRVIMKGVVQIDSAYSNIEEPFEQILLIPLGEQYFNITKGQAARIQDTIQERNIITIPQDRTQETMYGIGIVLLFIGIGVLSFGTQNFTREDLERKRVKALFKEHGSRMVGVDKVDASAYITCYKLATIQDLIKIADEIEKPVFYCISDDLIAITDFYVMQGDVCYIYCLEIEKVAEIEQLQEENMEV